MKFRFILFSLVFLSLIFAGGFPLGGQSPRKALEFLEDQEKPVFAENHNLPPLSHWRFLSPDVAKAFADDWGYALTLHVRPDFIEQLDDPDSAPGRIVRLARDHPEVYSLQLVVAPSRMFNYGLSHDDLPEGTFYRDADGNPVEGDYYFSPLAPNSAFVRIGRLFAGMIEEVERYAPVSIILNGGEYGLKKPYFDPRRIAGQDPAVMEAWRDDGRSWLEFTSSHKGRQERIVRRVLLRAAPEARYIHYSEVGGGHPRRKMIPDWEDHDFLYQPGVSDFAAPPLYFRHANSGFTGPRDMLSQLLNARAQELAVGAEQAYYWVSAGWYRRDPDRIADVELYEGFLKMCYLAGGIGTIAGYFAARPYQDPVEQSFPQFLAQGRVHAYFSHLDEFLFESRLLPGPDRHRWSRDLPAYEFPTGNGDRRVLARKHRDRDQWLVGAWAADGRAGPVEVEIPSAGTLELEAAPNTNVYRIEIVDGMPHKREPQP